MRAYKCDICGGLYEDYSLCDNLNYHLKYKTQKDKNGKPLSKGIIEICYHMQSYCADAEYSPMDICPDCRKAICDFINERVIDK